MIHPRDALWGSEPLLPALPVCDHYAGTEPRMRKSLELQRELGPVLDVTLDCEDGAPVGREAEQAQCVAALVMSPLNQHGRVGARVHPFGHPAFEHEVDTLIRHACPRLAYLMVPKPRDAADAAQACAFIDDAIRRHHPGDDATAQLPLHLLIETHGALRDVHQIAAHPRVQSLSFGLMDFVSVHRGAIPTAAMSAAGQFSHPLVLRAKLEISAACHAHGKTPSHNVVTEFNDDAALAVAARTACEELGYTRMWSIHPQQIRTIVEAFTPSLAQVETALEIVTAAQAADWAPIRHQNILHDRASVRWHWQLLERARRTGLALPAAAEAAFFSPVAPSAAAAPVPSVPSSYQSS